MQSTPPRINLLTIDILMSLHRPRRWENVKSTLLAHGLFRTCPFLCKFSKKWFVLTTIMAALSHACKQRIPNKS